MIHTKLTFPALFRATLEAHSERYALTFVDETPITYKELNNEINSLIAFLKTLQIQHGDKVAILGNNMPQWVMSYYAVTFMGAVAVPLLPDFHPNEVNTILEHSEAKCVIVSEALVKKLEDIDNKSILKVLMEDFSLINKDFFKINPKPLDAEEKQIEIEPDNLAAIIYTSGTTGRPKGVMLTHKNIAYTAIQARTIQEFNCEDRFLSILPLSHTYENTLGMVLPMTCGACVYYLRKPPVASVLLPALSSVKPTAMLTVPLIIEKLYRGKIRPNFNRRLITRALYSFPPTRKVLSRIAGKRLKATFGGNLKFYGVGGAKLDAVVERFLKEAKFPYAIGYGMTEASPLLAGSNPHTTRLESTGPAMEGVSIKIVNPNPITGEGEIWAKGENIMQGYYKDRELTAETITADGWLKTGDLGYFKNNELFIRGRLKNLIIGASGENIYPEDIEFVINNFKYVIESLVVEQKGKLVALVHFNYEELEKRYHDLKEEVVSYVENKVDELGKELHEYVNRKVNRFSQLHQIVLQPVPFEKTATKKIKRFLYTGKMLF